MPFNNDPQFTTDGQLAGQTRGEKAYREYLIDTVVRELTYLQKRKWISDASFDTMVQQLNLDRDQPHLAYGRSRAPQPAAAGVKMDPYRSTSPRRIDDSRSPPAPKLPGRAQKQVVAIADYNGDEEDSLPFREGDVIDILRDVDDNWHWGRLRGREGMVPRTYVEAHR
ncbi:SH3 domain-containing protein [Cladochytrium replicatum]|nr:SH3 domain-containing protein [Cladochytrium replicatum]